MKIFLAIGLIFNCLFVYADPNVTVSVDLTPAGSFQAVSTKVKGNLVKQAQTFTSDKIYVSVESFKTGIDLRDEHFWKHLNASKHPRATLFDVKGQNGKGTGTLEVNGIKRPVNISYTEKGKEVQAKFKVKASDFSLPKASYLGVGVNDVVEVQTTIPFTAK